MKRSSVPTLWYILPMLASLALPTSPVRAADGTWNTTVTGLNWGAAGNWQGGAVAGGAGSTARFDALDITTDTTVRLDAPLAVSRLVFSDAEPVTAGGWVLDNGGNASNTLTLAGTAPTITVNILGAEKAAEIKGVIAGSGGLTKDGAGMLILQSSNNTYTGGTVINGGILKFQDISGRVSTNSGNGKKRDPVRLARIRARNTEIDQSLGAVPASFDAANVTINNGGTLQLACGTVGSMTYHANRGIILGAGIQNLRKQIGVAWAQWDGVISGAGGLNVVCDKGHEIRLAGENTYTGDTRLYCNLGCGVTNTWLSLQNSTLDYVEGGGQVNFYAAPSAVFGGLKGDKALKLRGNQRQGLALFVGNNGQDTKYAGVLSDLGALVKIGTGTLTLTGANTYSGGTTVSNGALWVDNTVGTGTGSGAVNVAGGATLGGKGRIAGFTTIAGGGRLAPGGSAVGKLTFSGLRLAFNDGALLDYGIGGTDVAPATDGIVLTHPSGTITFGDSATLKLSLAPDADIDPTGKTFVLFSYQGTDPMLPLWAIDYGATKWQGGSVSVNNKRVVLSGVKPILYGPKTKLK